MTALHYRVKYLPGGWGSVLPGGVREARAALEAEPDALFAEVADLEAETAIRVDRRPSLAERRIAADLRRPRRLS